MKRRKTACLLLALLLLSLHLTAPAQAAGAAELVISAPESMKQGERFDISVGIAENPGLASMQLRIVFPDAWRLVSSTAGEKFGDSMLVSSPTSESPAVIVWANQNAGKTDGELMRLRFEADVNAASGTGLVIVQCQNAYTGDEEPVALSQKSARISVVELAENERPTLKLSRASGMAEGRVAVEISASNNFRASTAHLTLLYDAQLLELVEIVPKPGLPAEIYWSKGSPDIAWASLNEITDRVIATCIFRLLSTDENAYPASVELTGKLYDVAENEIHGTVFAGTEVEGPNTYAYTLGDINRDGKVNIQDVVRLLNHVNNSDKLDDDSVGDINGDGKINIQDVIRLLNHVNNSDKLY